MKSEINIAVDIDGVCSDFSKKFSELCHEEYGKKCYIIDESIEIKYWQWEKWYPISTKEVLYIWEKIQNIKNFWMTLEILDIVGWEYFINIINKNKNINVYFITSREKTKGDSIVNQSIEWLKSKGLKNPLVIADGKKGDICKVLNIKFFIDDKDKNIIDVKNKNPDCKVYAKDVLHNSRGLNDSDIEYKRVRGLKIFMDDVVDYLEAGNYEKMWGK